MFFAPWSVALWGATSIARSGDRPDPSTAPAASPAANSDPAVQAVAAPTGPAQAEPADRDEALIRALTSPTPDSRDLLASISSFELADFLDRPDVQRAIAAREYANSVIERARHQADINFARDELRKNIAASTDLANDAQRANHQRAASTLYRTASIGYRATFRPATSPRGTGVSPVSTPSPTSLRARAGSAGCLSDPMSERSACEAQVRPGGGAGAFSPIASSPSRQYNDPPANSEDSGARAQAEGSPWRDSGPSSPFSHLPPRAIEDAKEGYIFDWSTGKFVTIPPPGFPEMPPPADRPPVEPEGKDAAAAALDRVLDALQHNDTPATDTGIATACDAQHNGTGHWKLPWHVYARRFKTHFARGLLNHLARQITVESYLRAEVVALATLRVHLEHADGRRAIARVNMHYDTPPWGRRWSIKGIALLDPDTGEPLPDAPDTS